MARLSDDLEREWEQTEESVARKLVSLFEKVGWRTRALPQSRKSLQSGFKKFLYTALDGIRFDAEEIFKAKLGS